MYDLILSYRLGFLLFALLSLAGMAWGHWWLCRSHKSFGIPSVSWIWLLVIIACGGYFSELAGQSERNSLRKMLEGFAPTYAYEFQRMGHERVGLETPADDPLYLALIDSEKHWLKINPLVNDIYTFRMKPDGTVVLVVDSETDYDRNGRYEGDREVRTAIGEVYPESDENLKRAFQGIPSFDGVPYTDRWGTWVSAYAPILDSRGRVDAVLGVDYAASSWTVAILKRRWGVLGYTLIIIIFFIAGLTIVRMSRREKQMLDESLERFRLLSKATNDTTWDWNVLTNVLFWGDGIRSVYGYAAGQAGSDLIWWENKIHPDDRDRVTQSVKRVLAGESLVWSSEYRFERADRTYVDIYDRGYLIRDIEGKPVRMIGAMMDITEVRRAQVMLSKATTENIRLALAVEAASDGIIMTDPNLPDNPVVYANASFLNITGYGMQEVIGRNCRFLQGPETDPEAVKEVHEAIREKKSAKVTLINYRKDGTKFWNGLRISPVFSNEGRLQYFLGFQADVTQRMEMLEELRQSEEAFRYMLLSAPVMVWMAGPDKKFIYVNRFWAEFTGRKVKEELEDGWLEGVHPDDRAPLMSAYDAAFRNQLDCKSEFRLRHVSGEYRWLTATGTPSFKEDGSFAGFIGSCLDIHERKKLESQLLQAQKMETVGTLAGGIAHDLNNQLTPLSGYIDLVMKETPAGDPRLELLVEAEQAARRCAEVVQRLMNFSRTSTQKKSWLKTQTVMEELKRILPKLLPKTIATHVTFSADLWPVMGNETELQTILMNLSTNARDAMPQGGRLEVTAENKELGVQSVRGGHSPGTYVLISVKDSGQGIPPHLLSKIFEPFFTTKQKGQGTGLGLAMVFRIVRDHGGWLDVSSVVGQGTVFQIYLPADPHEKAVKTDPGAPETLPRGSETILFADDEETLRNLGRVFLERLGYKVILANDGEEAVRLYQERRSEIGAVVLDMTMPKMTGRQAMKKLLEINPSVRILLASGYTSEGSAKELIGEGAMDFLPKPFTIMPLAQALRKVIGQP